MVKWSGFTSFAKLLHDINGGWCFSVMVKSHRWLNVRSTAQCRLILLPTFPVNLQQQRYAVLLRLFERAQYMDTPRVKLLRSKQQRRLTVESTHLPLTCPNTSWAFAPYPESAPSCQMSTTKIKGVNTLDTLQALLICRFYGPVRDRVGL
ncbi:hypothetical protein RND81_11G035200 [Saponaria officinalis]|uniref:Uncharacterized protein n=1 Tax=Saponaria officinalis TaxID=3572 RepID=A0AAW1HJ39_SAPOF